MKPGINARDAIYFFWEQKNPGDFWWLDVNAFPSRSNRIFNNTLRDNASSGIYLQDSTDNQVHNNVFSNNAKNIKLQGNTNGNDIRDNQEGMMYEKFQNKFLRNLFWNFSGVFWNHASSARDALAGTTAAN